MAYAQFVPDTINNGVRGAEAVIAKQKKADVTLKIKHGA
jgi:hypothetical protein